jgi:drug/metabolite transporter (DMT)-like permease
MSIVAPIAATGVAVPVVVGIAGGERPAALQLGGIATAVIGVVLASREEDAALPDPMPSPARRDRIRAAASGDRRRPPARRDRSRPAASRDRTRSPASISVLLALIAAIGFGTFFVALRSTARVNLAWALLAARASGAAVLVAAAAVERTAPVRDRPALAALVVIGLLDLAANGFYALATRHGLLSVVSVGASLYPLATVLLARVVLRERVRRVQEVGIVAALAGVVLIAAG